MKYKISMQTYSTIAVIKEEQEKAGFIGQNYSDYIQPSDLLKRDETKRIKFKDAFEEYSKLKSPADKFVLLLAIDIERIQLLEQYYPKIKQAFELLGIEEVRRLKYNQTNINKKLVSLSDKSFENKIFRLLVDSGIKANAWFSSETIKTNLQRIYNALEIKKTAKATDLSKYFEVEQKSKEIDLGGDKKLRRGFQILREKIVFTQKVMPYLIVDKFLI